jgi:hypothetical protein
VALRAFLQQYSKQIIPSDAAKESVHGALAAAAPGCSVRTHDLLQLRVKATTGGLSGYDLGTDEGVRLFDGSVRARRKKAAKKGGPKAYKASHPHFWFQLPPNPPAHNQITHPLHALASHL